MKKKVIIYSVIILLFVCFTGIGTYSIIMAQQYKNNDVSFNLENETAFCEITANYYLGQNAINSNTPSGIVHKDSYTEQDYYSSNGKNDGKNLKTWNIGETWFVSGKDDETKEVDIIKLEISIKNLNSVEDSNNVSLLVSMYNVAVHEYFYTKITYSLDGVDTVKFDNHPDNKVGTSGSITADVAQQEIPEGSTLTVSIEFKRNVTTKDIHANNNIMFDIEGSKIN